MQHSLWAKVWCPRPKRKLYKNPEKETWCKHRDFMSEYDSLSLSYSTFKCGCTKVYILSVNTVFPFSWVYFCFVSYLFVMYLCVWWMCIQCHAHTGRSGATCKIWLSPSTIWMLEIGLESSSSATNVLPCWASCCLWSRCCFWFSVVKYTSGYLLSISWLILLLCIYLHFP